MQGLELLYEFLTTDETDLRYLHLFQTQDFLVQHVEHMACSYIKVIFFNILTIRFS